MRSSPLFGVGSARRRAQRRKVQAWPVAVVAVLATCSVAAVPSAQATAPAKAPTFSADYLGGVSGARPLAQVDLAGTWDFTPLKNTVCTGEPARPTTGPMTCVDSPVSGVRTTIQVPGGGWLKQGWDKLSKAVYSRTVTVPKVGGAQATRLDFGAVNHRATVQVDGRTVGSNTTAYTASVFDLTPFVRPGGRHRIDVTVEGRKAFVGSDGRYTVPEGASWSDDVAQGIFRSAALKVFPAVYVSDTFVRPSVTRRELAYDVAVTNTTARPHVVTLGGRLNSWNGARWKYPSVPRRTAVVPANTTSKITMGPFAWRAGPSSYWWPNVPYKPGYKAQLHQLDITMTRPAAPASRYHVRFGFRELRQTGGQYELNGVHVNFRGDSLQGANYDNIDFHGRSDAYDTFPGFLKPSKGNGGWPQAVRTYQRLNYNSVRIHQVPATPYMLDVTDELGLMIQGETAIRGSNNRENFVTGRANMVQHLADVVVRDRNHASVLRWSQANEPRVAFFTNPGAGPEFDELLYRTVKMHDPTRPISTDGDSEDLPHPDYTVFCHYDGQSFGAYSESICAGPKGKPQGQGEFLWWRDSTPQGMAWFGTATMRMREQGADDARPYTLLSAWASVIPGVKKTDMRLEISYPNGPNPVYGEDNLPDPWNNRTINLIQDAFNPVAVIDTEFWNANKMSNTAGAWPTVPTPLKPGRNTRSLSLFNDDLRGGERLTITWRLRAGTATGKVVDAGRLTKTIPTGDHRLIPVTLDVPNTNQALYLDLRVTKPGQGELFRNTNTVYQVQPN
ncbi:glycoside hydrolase family 2 TIM barrel-domain containing protein [Spirillospora sp. NPDC048911]|uniref:glycoside hydrolase family 2 TIM barrel-domain containing protein n=1 Tax=Spirillospora sp. NPDC048911 TaxID=3364527 RepID=UPI00371AB89D